MKYFLICTFLFCFQFLQAQDFKEEKNITYATVFSWEGKQQDLKMDIAYQQLNKKLPLVVYIHGGGFQNGNKEGDEFMNPLLAQNGFVVANIDYRLGFDPSDQQGIIKAFYRGAQDLDAALRYLVHNANKYNIDTTAIFIGGSSAGGVLALANAYEKQSEWDAVFPMLHQDLGAVTGAGNSFTDNYSVRGVYSLWGGIIDTTLISGNDIKAMPVLLVASQSDEVIPYEHAKGESAEFKVLYGSYDIAERFRKNGGCYDLYFVKDARHGHGFSQAYVVNAISLFVNDVLSGNCKKTTIENTKSDNSKFFGDYKSEP